MQISLIISFIVFSIAGWDSLNQNYFILAISNFLLAAANIASLLFLKKRVLAVNISLFILNAVLAILLAYSYFNAGKKALPVAWFLVGIFNLFFAINNYKKNNPASTSVAN